MTPSTCTTCGRDCAVGMTHTQRVPVKGWVQWRQCRGCELEERKRQDERAARAIEQAERSGA